MKTLPDTGDTVTIQGPRFAQMPESLLYDGGISDGAVRVYGVLLRHGETSETCFPGHRRIAELIGKAERSIGRLLTELETAGWIVRTYRKRRGQHTTTAYTVYTVRPLIPTAQNCAPAITQNRAVAIAQNCAPNDNQVNESQPNDVKATSTLLEIPSIDPLLGFEQFWHAYPKRNGKRLGRGKCEALWQKIADIDDRRAAYRGAVNYAGCADVGDTIAKDPERWLRDRCWTDWQSPAEQPVARIKPHPLDRGGPAPADLFAEAAANERRAIGQ